MYVDILTIFPDMFESYLSQSIMKRAQEKSILSVNMVNIRDYAFDKHHTTDDYPYGGGAGMVMKPEPVFSALEAILELPYGFISSQNLESWRVIPKPRIILMSPQGVKFNQDMADALSVEERIIFVCGRYEGFDERIRQYLVTDEISIGDFVLTGGELPAMVILDAVTRLIPGVLGGEDSAQSESFTEGLLEYPQYTRPPDFRGWPIPEVLNSGHHEQIRKWRKKLAISRTLERRPDLLEQVELDKEGKKMLDEILLKIEDRR